MQRHIRKVAITPLPPSTNEHQPVKPRSLNGQCGAASCVNCMRGQRAAFVSVRGTLSGDPTRPSGRRRAPLVPTHCDTGLVLARPALSPSPAAGKGALSGGRRLLAPRVPAWLERPGREAACVNENQPPNRVPAPRGASPHALQATAHCRLVITRTSHARF